MCAKKLMERQLNLAHGTKNKKSKKKELQTKTDIADKKWFGW